MLDPQIARRTWRTVEPIHSGIYFDAEANACYERAGLQRRVAYYFAARAAPLGAASAELVIATFFNFSPDLVRKAIPAAWEQASPARVLEARLEGADLLLRRVLGDRVASPELAEAARLARRAAEAASERPEGRPLFAGHASLPWPDDSAPHLVLWHAQTLLREFRGDGHIAALVTDGVTGIEALVMHAATGELPERSLRVTRGWPDDVWESTVESLRSQGLLAAGDELALSEAGQRRRAVLEARTDELAVPAYEVLGEDGCARLRALARPFSQAVLDSGAVVFNVTRLPEESK